MSVFSSCLNKTVLYYICGNYLLLRALKKRLFYFTSKISLPFIDPGVSSSFSTMDTKLLFFLIEVFLVLSERFVFLVTFFYCPYLNLQWSYCIE